MTMSNFIFFFSHLYSICTQKWKKKVTKWKFFTKPKV